MSGVKWSNDAAFPDGDNCEIGDIVVGLRGGANYKFDFPSDGIKDGNSNYLVGWATTGAAATDYMQFTNGEAGTPSSITMTSSGSNASLDIILKGTGVLDVIGLFTINGSTSMNAILDEDNMSSDSATALATQQSIKAYVDSQIAGTPTSIVGTEFQVLANGNFGTNETGTVTLTTPQDIATTSSPTFAGLDVDNININGNTISSTDTNGDINLTPDGTGTVVVGTDLDVDNINIDGNSIISTDTNGDINITADGSGEVVIDGVGWKSLTNGQLFIGNTGAVPTAATLTAGTGISIANGGGSITISGSGGGYSWTEVTGTSQAMAVNNGYITNNAGLVTCTLPATAAIGDTVIVQGKGAGGWRIAQNADQTINFGASPTTTGAGGYIESTNQFDSVELLCITANTDWAVLTAPQGTLTVA